MARNDMVAPRRSCSMSAMVSAASVSGVDPEQPTMKRKPMSMFRFVLTAQATVKATKGMLQARKRRRWSYISNTGATTRGPKAKPRSYEGDDGDGVIIAPFLLRLPIQRVLWVVAAILPHNIRVIVSKSCRL